VTPMGLASAVRAAQAYVHIYSTYTVLVFICNMVRTCSHAVQYVHTLHIYCIISIYVEGGTVANLFSYLLCNVLYHIDFG
jgi:hypothetical protein